MKSLTLTAFAAALALLSAQASAQSSVTVFGVVDTAVRVVKNGDGASVKSLTNDGLASSRIGFRGVEDLGGGMSAAFWLEGAMAPDAGTIGTTAATNGTGSASQAPKFFNRRSTVSLLGNFGEIRLGRDYLPSFWNLSLFHAYGGVGVGNLLNVMGSSGALNVTGALGSNAGTLVRADNSIGYYLPSGLGGLYGQATWAADEGTNAVNGNNHYVGARIGWAGGPFDIAGAVARTQVPGNGDFKVWNLGASYRIAAARVMLAYHHADFQPSGLARRKQDIMALSAVVPVGQGEFRAAYQRSDIGGGSTAGLRDADDSNQIAVGYIHHLSKRTALYTDYGRLQNKGLSALTIPGGATTGSNLGTVANRDSTALALGIRHTF